MLKRILSTLIAMCMLLTLLPVTAMAEYTVNGRDDVVVLESYGTGYMIYTVNGHRYDSRDKNKTMNAKAYKALSDEDKNKLTGCFYNKKQKDAQFGEECGELISQHARKASGMCKISEAFALSVERKMLGEYNEIFGSAEGEPDYWYYKTLGDMMVFDVDTPAQIILTKYINTPKGKIFGEKYVDIEVNMRVAKKQYDELLNIYVAMMNTADKAILWDGFKLIVDNALYPSPSGELSGIINDSFWCTLDQIDAYTGLLGETYFKMDTQGIISDFKTWIMQDTKVGGANASKIIKKLRPVADARKKALDMAYITAKDARAQLIEEAPSVLDDIKKELEEKRIAAELKAAFAQMEQDRKRDEAKNAIDNTTPNTAAYYYIQQLRPTADSDKQPDVYAEQQRRYSQACAEASAALSNRYTKWEEETKLAYDNVIKNANFRYWDNRIGGTGYFDSYSGSRENAAWSIIDFEYNSSRENYGWVTESNKSTIKNELDDACSYYDSAASKIGNFYLDLKNMLSDRENALRAILSDSEGYDAVVYASLYNQYYQSGLKLLQDMSGTGADCFGLNAPAALVTLEEAQEAADNKKNFMQENYNALMANYADYKDRLKDDLEEYLNLQSSFYLNWANYNNAIADMKDIADNRLPDYVYNQAVTGYASVGVDDKRTIYFTGGEFLVSTGNQLLRDKIAAAEKTSAGSHYFFKTEAQKLSELIAEYDDLENKKNASYRWGEDYKIQLSRLCEKLIDADYLRARGVEPREFKTASEINRETNIYIDETYFNYRLTYDQLKNIAAAYALLRDFKGCTFTQSQFTEEMAKREIEFGNTARMIKNGELSEVDFINNYSSHLHNTLNRFKQYSMYSYSGPYANIGEPDEISFEEMVFGENGYITRLYKLYDEMYIPVERIRKDNIRTRSDDAEVVLDEGGRTKLSAVVEPENATFKGIKWRSLDPDIASVDSDGNVTALAGGTATIVAVADDSEVYADTETVDGVEQTVYRYNDDYVLSYTVDVSQQPYTPVSALDKDEYDDDEQSLVTYSFVNYGSDEVPKYYEVSGDDKTVTVKYRPSAGSDETVLLELFDENGELLASEKCNNTQYERALLTLSATAERPAVRIKVSSWLDEDCTEYNAVLFEENTTTDGQGTVIISYDSDNGKIVINSDTSYANAKLLIAEYSSDGVLIGVSPYTISIKAQVPFEKEYTASESYTTKIMLWNSLNKIKPLAAYLDEFEYNDEY